MAEIERLPIGAGLRLVESCRWIVADPREAAPMIPGYLARAAGRTDDPIATLRDWRALADAGQAALTVLEDQHGTAHAAMLFRVYRRVFHVLALQRLSDRPGDRIGDAFHEARRLAAEFDCEELRFETHRPALVRRLARDGFELVTAEMRYGLR